ncbi:Uncharacterised protein [Vibrio cholerae]|nr:Uncharacterised protein [Vibrio cholerae]
MILRPESGSAISSSVFSRIRLAILRVQPWALSAVVH